MRTDGSKKQKAVRSGRVEKNITTVDCDANSAKEILVKRWRGKAGSSRQPRGSQRIWPSGKEYHKE